jgi:heptosyltransferase-2
MRILIELPTWLGDTVMSTPAIENIIHYYNKPEIVLIGSKAALEIFRYHPDIGEKIQNIKTFFGLFELSKNIGHFDVFFSFRSSFRSSILKILLSSEKKYQYRKNQYKNRHQVEKFNEFTQDSLKTFFSAGHLNIYRSNKPPIIFTNLTLGVHPGATYGDAKKWYPEEFAKVLFRLSNQYDIIIFGSPKEKNIADEIEKLLISSGVSNYSNLAGKTSICDLINHISSLDLFITGDSGPMHIASSFQIPTISIFGPTNYLETSQWLNEKNIMVKKNLECQPCMQRSCPLSHHNCMRFIKSHDVIDAVNKLELRTDNNIEVNN